MDIDKRRAALLQAGVLHGVKYTVVGEYLDHVVAVTSTGNRVVLPKSFIDVYLFRYWGQTG